MNILYSYNIYVTTDQSIKMNSQPETYLKIKIKFAMVVGLIILYIGLGTTIFYDYVVFHSPAGQNHTQDDMHLEPSKMTNQKQTLIFQALTTILKNESVHGIWNESIGMSTGSIITMVTQTYRLFPGLYFWIIGSYIRLYQTRLNYVLNS